MVAKSCTSWYMVYPLITPLFTMFHSYLPVANWCRISSIHSMEKKSLKTGIERWFKQPKWDIPAPPLDLDLRIVFQPLYFAGSMLFVKMVMFQTKNEAQICTQVERSDVMCWLYHIAVTRECLGNKKMITAIVASTSIFTGSAGSSKSTKIDINQSLRPAKKIADFDGS